MFDRTGAFGWIFNTPSHHRMHHGSNTEYLDRDIAKDLWREKGRHALGYLFRPPGWSPDGSTLTARQLQHPPATSAAVPA